MKKFLPFLLIPALLMNGCNYFPSSEQIFKTVRPADLRLSYNSKTTALENGNYRTEFHGKWVNYLDKSHTWKAINPDFIKTGKGFEMTHAPFEVIAPFYADEAAIFNNNNRYDVFTNEIIYDKPLEQTIQALGTEHVAGKVETGDLGWGKAQYVVYPNAYPQYHADLIYWVHQGKAPRLRKFIRFNEKLTTNTDFRFRVIYSDAVETVNSGKNITVKLKDTENKRGTGWADFYFWDSKEGWAGRKPIRFDFEKPLLASTGNSTINSNEYILTKHIEADYFKTAILPAFTDATSTFYPDPNTETTTVDGRTYVLTPECNGSGYSPWSALVAAPAMYSQDDQASDYILEFHTDACDLKQRRISRGIFLFQTSSLTSGAVISAATFSVYGTLEYREPGWNASAPDINVFSSNPANNTSIALGDHQNNGTTPFSTAIPYAVGWNPSGFNDFVLNASGITAISKTGVSKFSIRNGNYDAANVAPNMTTGNHYFAAAGYYAEQPGTSEDPKLVVTYTIPTPPTPATIDWNNSNTQEIILSANRSFTFTNGKSGAVYSLLLKQDATGGRGITWPANVKWAGGATPIISTGANAVDVVRFIYDGTNYLTIGSILDIK